MGTKDVFFNKKLFKETIKKYFLWSVLFFIVLFFTLMFFMQMASDFEYGNKITEMLSAPFVIIGLSLMLIVELLIYILIGCTIISFLVFIHLPSRKKINIPPAKSSYNTLILVSLFLTVVPLVAANILFVTALPFSQALMFLVIAVTVVLLFFPLSLFSACVASNLVLAIFINAILVIAFIITAIISVYLALVMLVLFSVISYFISRKTFLKRMGK